MKDAYARAWVDPEIIEALQTLGQVTKRHCRVGS